MDKTMLIDESLIDLPEDLIRTQLDADALTELAASITFVGQLQAVLVKTNGDRFTLVAGFRRLTAIRILNKKKILATIKPVGYAQTEAIALIENIQREDMPPYDEARCVRSIVDSHGWGIPKTAQHLGKSEAWVRGRLDILRLPETIANLLQTEQIGIGVALELARIPDQTTRDTFAAYAAEGGCTLTQAQRWRATAERDAISGFGTSPPLKDPDQPREVYEHGSNINCAVCGRDFPADRLRILKSCPLCFETIKMEAYNASQTDIDKQHHPEPEDTTE